MNINLYNMMREKGDCIISHEDFFLDGNVFEAIYKGFCIVHHSIVVSL